MAINILNGNFQTQDFRNLENVNQDNMNNLSQNKDMQIAGYFYNYNKSTVGSSTIQTGSICTGIGSICPYGQLSAGFGQASLSSTTFTLYPGVIRFADQEVPYAGGSYSQTQAVRAVYTAGGGSGAGSPTDVTITVPGSDTKYYVVAVVDLTTTDAYTETFTCSISTTAISVADLIANQSLDNPTYVALFYIYTPGTGSYYVGSDQYCANNYNVEPCAGVPQNGFIVNPQDNPNFSVVDVISYNGFVGVPEVQGQWRTYSNGVTKLILKLIAVPSVVASQISLTMLLDLYTFLTANNLPTSTNSLIGVTGMILYANTIYIPSSAFVMTSATDVVTGMSASNTIVSPSPYSPFGPNTPTYFVVNSTYNNLGIMITGYGADSSVFTATMDYFIELELTDNP